LIGKYPKILNDAVVGEEARKLFADAQKELSLMLKDKSIKARGVYGFWPANSDGDDIVLWTDETRTKGTDAFPDAASAVGTSRADDVSIAGRLCCAGCESSGNP
jgi:cobalamin-dependent methionine synthase I